MNETNIQIRIDDYLSQFNHELDNEDVPTKIGYLKHMGITDKSLNDSNESSYELNRGLQRVNVYLEESLRLNTSMKLNKVMAELVNSFDYHY
jgi:hypothetical protein